MKINGAKLAADTADLTMIDRCSGGVEVCLKRYMDLPEIRILAVVGS